MDRLDDLNGKAILIGKEPGQGRLCISVVVNGKPLAAVMGTPGCVPSCVSRCKPSEGMAHCKIEVDPSGKMTLVNLKPQNVTYVNDVEIESKRINPYSSITLGRDKYAIDLDAVLRTAVKLADSVPQPPKEYSIKHLEKIWDEYELALDKIQRYQQNKARRRLVPIMVGFASTILAPIFATTLTLSSLYVTLPIAAISFILYIKLYMEKDSSFEDKKKATNQFQDNYVCPNPQCRHFMGYQPYKILKQNKKCLYCGCLFSHEQS